MESALQSRPSARRPRDERCRVVSANVNISDYDHATETIIRWARHREHRFVCVTPVHPIMEAFDDERYREIINSADFVTADGMPVVWTQRLLGYPHATRVYGPSLALRLCERCLSEELPIGLYGGSPTALEAMKRALGERFPGLPIPYAYSPPYRALTPEEDERVADEIRRSGCQLLLVGLGTPKQDIWMAEHRLNLPLVQIGVGAAFDFIAGLKKQAPPWMQRNGLEWLFRLCSEPRRLWFRYLWHNPRFVALVAWQLIQQQLSARIT